MILDLCQKQTSFFREKLGGKSEFFFKKSLFDIAIGNPPFLTKDKHVSYKFLKKISPITRNTLSFVLPIKHYDYFKEINGIKLKKAEFLYKNNLGIGTPQQKKYRIMHTTRETTYHLKKIPIVILLSNTLNLSKIISSIPPFKNKKLYSKYIDSVKINKNNIYKNVKFTFAFKKFGYTTKDKIVYDYNTALNKSLNSTYYLVKLKDKYHNDPDFVQSLINKIRNYDWYNVEKFNLKNRTFYININDFKKEIEFFLENCYN